MTFSVVARCPRTGQLGVAACTAMVGVGKLVCHAQAKVGAIATQAYINPYYGIQGLDMLSNAHHAGQVLETLTDNDPRAERRQAGIIDSTGQTAAWTGEQTAGWAGHLAADQCCAQGNRLVGPETLHATVEAFLANPQDELVDRLLAALEAGQATGADRKGACSANIIVVDTEAYPLWDMRIDEAEDPIKAIAKLHKTFSRRLIPNIRRLPTKQDPAGQLIPESDNFG